MSAGSKRVAKNFLSIFVDWTKQQKIPLNQGVILVPVVGLEPTTY